MLTITDVRRAEGTGGTTKSAFPFQVRLSAVTDRPVTVAFRTVAGTAHTPADYVARMGTVTIPAGAMSAKVVVRVVRDRTLEPEERFTVRLSTPLGATLADGSGRGTIVSDD